MSSSPLAGQESVPQPESPAPNLPAFDPQRLLWGLRLGGAQRTSLPRGRASTHLQVAGWTARDQMGPLPGSIPPGHSEPSHLSHATRGTAKTSPSLRQRSRAQKNLGFLPAGGKGSGSSPSHPILVTGVPILSFS